MALTVFQRQEYVEHGGTMCPYCREEEVNGGPVEINVGSATQEINCLACGETWTDYYKLDSILEDEEVKPS